ncbi:glutamate--cysteine ligase [Aldersonia sp. NBC_00410]|uniref:carboxylate-amine ligase n=1 Tax=Aldersonia sp. NBC_00410 TaxID=2975954 RepID=UPI00224EAFD7|nr:glutamate--cysteine ligase [Aldersonia sp. NBC_00410]MCX5045099.1 glutamate--cysteine ligase [Aldersonia sp. NBC_00410]
MSASAGELPTIGVEEELLLVDRATGHPSDRNRDVADAADALGLELQLELTSCQVETTTPVVSSSAELRHHLVELRSKVVEAAGSVGLVVLAVGIPPAVPDGFPITDTPRYRRIAQHYGMIAHEQGISGCHVHVAVPDREAAVQVSNHLRPALPILLALTANSAVYRAADSGFASWRHILWSRWPAAGPPPHLHSAAHYDAHKQMLLDTGLLLDDGMLYWDVRASENFPTVEVRVSDVPATVDETVTYATIVRALVLTALRELEAGRTANEVADAQLNAALWLAARDGLSGNGIDPATGAARPATDLLDTLLERIRPALEDLGEYDKTVMDLRERKANGNGAIRQRRAFLDGGIDAVLTESARLTRA